MDIKRDLVRRLHHISADLRDNSPKKQNTPGSFWFWLVIFSPQLSKNSTMQPGMKEGRQLAERARRRFNCPPHVIWGQVPMLHNIMIQHVVEHDKVVLLRLHNTDPVPKNHAPSGWLGRIWRPPAPADSALVEIAHPLRRVETHPPQPHQIQTQIFR
jgi:hypothetical protein